VSFHVDDLELARLYSGVEDRTSTVVAIPHGRDVAVGGEVAWDDVPALCAP